MSLYENTVLLDFTKLIGMWKMLHFALVVSEYHSVSMTLSVAVGEENNMSRLKIETCSVVASNADHKSEINVLVH